MSRKLPLVLFSLVALVLLLLAGLWLSLRSSGEEPAAVAAPTEVVGAVGDGSSLTVATSPTLLAASVEPSGRLAAAPVQATATARMLPTPTLVHTETPSEATTTPPAVGDVSAAGNVPAPRGLVINGSRETQLIALTFDACQTVDNPAGFDEALVQVLEETKTPATFFLGGLWARDHVSATQRLAANPLFELGNHSWSHLDFAQLDAETMQQEIRLAQQELERQLGRRPTLFRFPFGTYSEEALDVVAAEGLRPIQWDVVSGDPDPNVTADTMIPWVVSQAQGGSIIIMHVNGRGWHTADALPAIIQQLRAAGYTFVTVSTLLAD